MYYYRPWKTILVRTVTDGGQSYYFRGDHRQTIPTLWREAVRVCGTAEEASATRNHLQPLIYGTRGPEGNPHRETARRVG